MCVDPLRREHRIIVTPALPRLVDAAARRGFDRREINSIVDAGGLGERPTFSAPSRQRRPTHLSS